MILLPIFERPSSPLKYERPQLMKQRRAIPKSILDQMLDDPFHYVRYHLPERLVLRKSRPMGQFAVRNANFSIQLNASDFKPDEISVTVKDRQLIVQAKHEENDSGSFIRREFRREFTIPPDVNPETIEARVNDDGLLSVRAKDPSAQQVELKHNIQTDGRKDTEEEHRKTEASTVVSEQDDEVGGFVMHVKTDDFKPNEISIKIKDRQVIIEAKQEEKYSKSENDTVYSHSAHRELRREFTLPPRVDPETIVAEMKKDGLLKIKSSPKQESVSLSEDKQLDKPQEWIKLDVTRTETDKSSMDNQ